MTESISRRGLIVGGGLLGIAGIAAIGQTRLAVVGSTPEASPEMNASPMAMGGTAAAFMVITNTGTDDDTLLGGSTEVAEVTEIHEMKQDGDVMIMSPLPDGLVIPAGTSVRLEPGGYHVMFMGLRQDLKPESTYELTLTFATAGDVELTVPVYASIDAFESAFAEDPGEPVKVGALEITGVWTRMAPMLPSGSPMAMPEGSPEATPDM